MGENCVISDHPSSHENSPLHKLIFSLYLGILKEGRLLNQEFDAQKMAEKLRTFKSKIDILNCLVSLYTAESFLYKLVNISLRNCDMTKVNTLGPFCWLLYVAISGNKEYLVVYRGMTLAGRRNRRIQTST